MLLATGGCEQLLMRNDFIVSPLRERDLSYLVFPPPARFRSPVERVR
jgi:hypothetical protein